MCPGFFITEQNRALLTNSDGSYSDRGNTIIAHTPFRRFGLPEDLLGTLQILAREWSVMEITKEIQLRAGQGFDIEPVRTLDAIHLATALECRQIFRDLKIYTLDKRIEDNLKPMGLIGYETS